MEREHLVKFAWEGEFYGEGANVSLANPVPSGVLSPADLAPAKLATIAATLAGGRVVRGGCVGNVLEAGLRDFVRASNLEYVAYGIDHSRTLFLIDVGDQWGYVSTQVARFGGFDWSITLVSQDGVGALVDRWPDYQEWIRPEVPVAVLLPIAASVPVDLMAVHWEGVDRDMVEGVCGETLLNSLPASLVAEFHWEIVQA